MRFLRQVIPDVVVIEVDFNGDDRGYFAETFRQDLLNDFLGYEVNFIQDNESMSSKGVLRGLHYQIPPFAQSKLVRVTQGEVLDIAVDIRKGSPTYGKHVAVNLSSENNKQIFIPQGFAHGFLVKSESATFVYKVDNYYSSLHERGLKYNDKKLNINWDIFNTQLSLSQKDLNQPLLKEMKDYFDFYKN